MPAIVNRGSRSRKITTVASPTQTGLVVTSAALDATEVYSSELIQAVKWAARNSPARNAIARLRGESRANFLAPGRQRKRQQHQARQHHPPGRDRQRGDAVLLGVADQDGRGTGGDHTHQQHQERDCASQEATQGVAPLRPSAA